MDEWVWPESAYFVACSLWMFPNWISDILRFSTWRNADYPCGIICNLLGCTLSILVSGLQSWVLFSKIVCVVMCNHKFRPDFCGHFMLVLVNIYCCSISQLYSGIEVMKLKLIFLYGILPLLINTICIIYPVSSQA